MKRKLAQAEEMAGVKRRSPFAAAALAAEEEHDEEEEHEAEAVAGESEEDESSADEAGGAASEAEAEAPRKHVKGALSERDADLLAKRRAEQSRIENIVPYRNKQRTLIFCSRGVTTRFRHLMEDLRSLLPHMRREVKHDTKRNLHEINEMCDLRQCSSAMFFEARKSKDLYMWLAKTPQGPSVKFHVLNIHTMDELRLSGNCLKGSRPLLSFSKDFEDEREPALQLIKELFVQIFGTPAGHPKSKPFVDHVMTFSVLDGKIWFRHFQVTDSTTDAGEIKRALARGEETTKLVEIGPRFVLNLIKVFEGSFQGRTLRENEDYVSPNTQRGMVKRAKGERYETRKEAQQERGARSEANVLPEDELQAVFK